MSLSLYVNVFGHVRGGSGCARSVSHCGGLVRTGLFGTFEQTVHLG